MIEKLVSDKDFERFKIDDEIGKRFDGKKEMLHNLQFCKSLDNPRGKSLDNPCGNDNLWIKIYEETENDIKQQKAIPFTKESIYYFKQYGKIFNYNYHLIPYYWMPNWCVANDPSARTLEINNEN